MSRLQEEIDTAAAASAAAPPCDTSTARTAEQANEQSDRDERIANDKLYKLWQLTLRLAAEAEREELRQQRGLSSHPARSPRKERNFVRIGLAFADIARIRRRHGQALPRADISVQVSRIEREVTGRSTPVAKRSRHASPPRDDDDDDDDRT